MLGAGVSREVLYAGEGASQRLLRVDSVSLLGLCHAIIIPYLQGGVKALSASLRADQDLPLCWHKPSC